MYIDAHSHLDKYDSEIERAIAEIEQHQIPTVSVSMEPPAYAKSKAIEKRSGWVVSAFGVHPWDAPAFHTLAMMISRWYLSSKCASMGAGDRQELQ
jgi:TatD DNase family protein